MALQNLKKQLFKERCFNFKGITSRVIYKSIFMISSFNLLLKYIKNFKKQNFQPFRYQLVMNLSYSQLLIKKAL